MNNVPVHDDSAGFAAKLADATAEPWCNHDTTALTTTELAAIIAASPRFTGEAGAYFDECAARYGLDFTGLAWLQACLKADQDARESDGCTCCQVRTERPGADDSECPKCGHLLGSHYRSEAL